MGRVLALDFGTKRIGAAVSDPARTFATPLEVWVRRDPRLDAKHYRALIQENEVERIVLGLPIHTSGAEGTSAALARAWGQWLAEVTGLPIVFFDERYTTSEAEELLRASGLKPSERRARRDMLAAQIVLQCYLDAGCPEVERSAQPLDDPQDEEDRP